MKDLTVSERRVVVLAAVLAAAIGSLPVVAHVKTNVDARQHYDKCRSV
jgi:hypothetical protein